MTAKQRAARAKFKAVVAEAKKLRKKNPKLTQAQAVKQAFAISYSKAGKSKVGAVKKKAAPTKVKAKKSKRTSEMHTDTKSHNVNIRVVSGIKRNTGYIGRAIIKTFNLSELKKLNPTYFGKGNDKMFGVYARKLMVSPKLQSQVMIEAQKNIFGGQVFRQYMVRTITPDGQIINPKKFDTIFGAADYIGKNIII
jgi:hypothetical protein